VIAGERGAGEAGTREPVDLGTWRQWSGELIRSRAPEERTICRRQEYNQAPEERPIMIVKCQWSNVNCQKTLFDNFPLSLTIENFVSGPGAARR
jgi:hypothetical protein